MDNRKLHHRATLSAETEALDQACPKCFQSWNVLLHGDAGVTKDMAMLESRRSLIVTSCA